MKDLLCEVQASVFMEYQRATAKFGKFNNSPHESYAVIKEEREEAQDEAEFFDQMFEQYWEVVKRNNNAEQRRLLPLMREAAEKAASEWIQAAAMCFKATIPKEEQP